MNIDKISFTSRREDFFSLYMLDASSEERQRAAEIIDFYLSMDSDVSFAFSFVCDALAIRVFDGERFSFVFPYPITEKADLSLVVEKIVRYCILEEIEPIFENVPREEAITFFRLGFRHVNCDSDSADSETYRITLKNECALIDKYPKALFENVELTDLADEDIRDYARLWRDEENNKYWGYDYRDDYQDSDDGLFIELAKRDFALGSAVSLAIRVDGRFVGEALISSFDYKGGADVAIRILPEYHKQGYASAALSLVFDVAAQMGLVTLYARVYRENTASVRLFSKDADEKNEENGIFVFLYNLYE